jgi:hypothetical protein
MRSPAHNGVSLGAADLQQPAHRNLHAARPLTLWRARHSLHIHRCFMKLSRQNYKRHALSLRIRFQCSNFHLFQKRDPRARLAATVAKLYSADAKTILFGDSQR